MGNPVAKILARLADDAPPSTYIRAFHGSPYDFDRFDASKIGTGEGAQSFGHGLYFAGAEPVADWYRKELSGPPEIIVGGKPVRWIAPTKTPRERALRLLQKSAIRYYDSPEQAVREAMLDASDQYGGREVKPIIDSLKRLEGGGISFGPRPGKTYEVAIDHSPDRLLDYDAPLDGQSPYVRERLGRLGYVAPSIMRDAQERGTGFGLIETLRESYPSTPSVGVRLLRDAGVPGGRYFDQGSRASGEGTSNYVMFPGTEDSIHILRKYGLLGPVAAGAATMGEE